MRALSPRVVLEAGEPLNCKAMVEVMSAKGYWTSPGGKTPAATLYASLLRHIQKHGKAARFVKTDRVCSLWPASRGCRMNPNDQLADAIRNVTLAMQRAIEDGHRSRMIDADDLSEVLLAIADQLDPPSAIDDVSTGQ